MGVPRTLLGRLQQSLPLLARQLLAPGAELIAIAGDIPVVEVAFPDSERLSIYVTDAGAQLLCICYLWREADVRKSSRNALLETLLDLNPSVPLSSFGRIGEHYVLFGALSPDASIEDLALELSTLSENALDALATLAPYLR
jgi:hypothetical protein